MLKIPVAGRGKRFADRLDYPLETAKNLVLFSGRYKSLLVDGSGDFYLRTMCDYMHLNPIRTGYVEKGNALESYGWSSYGEYLRTARKRKPWLRVDRLLEELGCRDNGRGRPECKSYTEARACQEQEGEDDTAKQIRRGWKLGAADFLERLEEKVNLAPKKGSYHPEEVTATMVTKANRLIAQELEGRKLKMTQLTTIKKMHPAKAQMAKRLRKETTMTFTWIAQELYAGSPSTLASAIHQLKV